VDTLAANVGKLIEVSSLTNGNGILTIANVSNLKLCNEANDGDGSNDYSHNYLYNSQDTTNFAATVGNGVLLADGVSYNITSATIISTVPGVTTYDKITQDIANQYGIWVISKVSPYNVATYVYVGTKLSGDTSSTVKATYSTDAPASGLTKTATNNGATAKTTVYLPVTSGVKNTVTDITVTPTYTFAEVSYNSGAYASTYTKGSLTGSIFPYSYASGNKFTVRAENGVTTSTAFEVVVDESGATTISGIVKSVTNKGDGNVLSGPVTGYASVKEALSHKTTLNVNVAQTLTVTCSSDVAASTASKFYFANFAANFDFTAYTEAQIDGLIKGTATTGSSSEVALTTDGSASGMNLANNDTVVLKLVDNATTPNTWYVAFAISK
jgi:hypothetical protein